MNVDVELFQRLRFVQQMIYHMISISSRINRDIGLHVDDEIEKLLNSADDIESYANEFYYNNYDSNLVIQYFKNALSTVKKKCLYSTRSHVYDMYRCSVMLMELSHLLDDPSNNLRDRLDNDTIEMFTNLNNFTINQLSNEYCREFKIKKLSRKFDFKRLTAFYDIAIKYIDVFVKLMQDRDHKFIMLHLDNRFISSKLSSSEEIQRRIQEIKILIINLYDAIKVGLTP